jgi:PAS domain S-box-containing protein
MRSPSHEYRVQRRNGEVRWVEVRWFAYGDRRERGTSSVVGTVHDITQRKRTEVRLAEREAQLALFVEHSPAAIAMFDDRMRYLAVSRRFLSDYRLPAAADVIGRSHYEVFLDIPPRWREIHVRVLAGEELASEEDFFPRQDGRASWVRWSMKPWRTVTGRIGGAMLFAEVITDQVEARRALAESEARFRATFENAAVGIAHAAPDGRWLRVNEALCRIVGYPVDELLTKTFQDITHPDDLAAEVAQVELLCAGKIDSYDVDKRYIRKDGAVVWGRKTVSCVRKSDGSIDYFVSVVEDISARRAHEEQIHLLMREVNHRAKNMLNLVQAIARQTATREPGEFVARFTERIQALAANQDLLVRNEWRGVDVEELVRGQLAHFADLVASRIAMHGPKLRLNAAAAQAIGLALHELATNAGKYGALSTDRGHVDVCWGTDGDTLTMGWTERDGPPVSPPERRGFGSTVIDSMAKATVGGEVQLDYAPSGLVWRLTCPAANGLESRGRERIFTEGKNRTDNGTTSRVNAQTAA